MHHQHVEVNAVEPLDEIIKHGIVHIVDGRGKWLMRDGKDKVICRPCLAFGGVGGAEFFALGSGAAGRNDGIGQRFGKWNGECSAVAGLIDGWILEEA